MNNFDKVYLNIINKKNIMSEPYASVDDNGFDSIFMYHAKKFIDNIKHGEGWINENEVLSQFLNMFDQYRSPLINQSYIEKELFNYLKKAEIEISDRIE